LLPARAQESRWYQLSEQVVQLQEQGKTADAIPIAQQAVNAAQSTYGPSDQHLGLSLNVLGVLLTDQEKFAEAEATLERALPIMTKASGAMSRDAATVLGNLGDLYRVEGRYRDAEKFTQQALEIHAKVSGPEDRSVAVDAANLALILASEDKYADAEPLYRRAIAIDQKHSNGSSRDLSIDFSNLGDLYIKQGKYAEAEPDFLNALSIDIKLLGKDHPQIALDLANLAAAYMYEDKFSLAEPSFERAQAIEAAANQLNSATEAQILQGIAALARRECKYPGAEKVLLQALGNRAKALGPTHPIVASILVDLGANYELEMRYGDAERAYRQALDIDNKSLPAANLQSGKVMVKLAELYGGHGQWGAADRLYHDAIPIYLKVYGQQDERVADVVFKAADQLLAESKFNEATSGFTAAAAIYQKAKGDASPGLAHCYDRMASIADDGGKPDLAESLHKRALAILEKSYGVDSLELTDSLEGLARVEKESKRFADAEPLYLRVLKIDQANLKAGNPGLRDAEADLAALYYVWNKPVQAEPHFQTYLTNLMDEFRANAATMSERDRLIYFATQRYAFPLFFSFVLKFHDQVSELNGEMYDALLEQKGLIAESAAAMRAAVVASGDQEAVAMLDKLAAEKAQLAAMSTDQTNHGQQVTQLLQEANTLEQELMKRSAVLSRQKTLNAATWRDVQKALKPGESAVEITRFQFHNGFKPTANLIYVALVITSDCKQPLFVLLGDAKDLEAGPMMAFRADVGQTRGFQAEAAPEQSAGAADTRAAFTTFWKPLESVLGGSKRVYVAPDGVLNTIPIGLMAGADGKLVMEKYQLRIVNSTRDLLSASAAPPSKNAVLVGNPKFDLTPAQQREAAVHLGGGASRGLSPPATSGPPPTTAQVASRGGELKGANLNPLPSTQAEVDAVNKMLGNAGWKTETDTGELALKEAVTRVHGPRVVHIATHGFFLTDEQLAATAAAQGKKANLDVDPMLRSGLLFAGADRARAGDAPTPGVDDGVLTAYEASQINLEGTELVVLSACETGLGKELNSDGVFGLRRALQEVGAQAVMMSMWSVPDRETQELMALFYAKWLSGLDKPEALRQAQLEERMVVQKRYGKDLPYYWGAFVLVSR
jgi:CHAT domain-containing protein